MITHVAIVYQGRTYSLPRPFRHHDVIKVIYEATHEPMGQAEQGFLNDKGQFLRRKPALIEAKRCNQLIPRALCSGGNLFSEDVW